MSEPAFVDKGALALLIDDNPPTQSTLSGPINHTTTLAANGTRTHSWAPLTAGKPFHYSSIPNMRRARQRIRGLTQAYNDFPWRDAETSTNARGPDEKQALLADIFGMTLAELKDLSPCILPPFHINYGTNVIFKGSFFANVDLVILDECSVTIGARVLCGPRVGIYTVTPSTDIDERMAGFERAYPIEIGDDCWIGGGAIINGPSRLGRGCVVAAGAVVRGDFPDYSLIGGVPAKLIKRLDLPTGHFDPTIY